MSVLGLCVCVLVQLKLHRKVFWVFPKTFAKYTYKNAHTRTHWHFPVGNLMFVSVVCISHEDCWMICVYKDEKVQSCECMTCARKCFNITTKIKIEYIYIHISVLLLFVVCDSCCECFGLEDIVPYGLVANVVVGLKFRKITLGFIKYRQSRVNKLSNWYRFQS